MEDKIKMLKKQMSDLIDRLTKEENEYNKKPLPHLYNARVGGASYFNGLPETNILNLCFSTPNLNLSKLK